MILDCKDLGNNFDEWLATLCDRMGPLVKASGQARSTYNTGWLPKNSLRMPVLVEERSQNIQQESLLVRAFFAEPSYCFRDPPKFAVWVVVIR